MYKSYYGLKASPFQISTDPTFLWLGEKHREAIAMLKYGIQVEDHTGIVLLTGDTGTGKTTLINALFKSLGRDVLRAAIRNPSLEGMDFFNYIAASFGKNQIFSGKSQFFLAFEHFLKNAAASGKKVLLVIDEAQVLTDTMLREIRLFANFEQDGRSLIRIFLVGQPELRKKLGRPANRSLAQRITLNYHIDPLLPEETREYILYRLQVAGTSRPLFSSEAVQLVHQYAQGLPRQINVLCDHALLTGYVGNHKQISGDIIHECAGELSITQIPGPHRKRVDPPVSDPGKSPGTDTVPRHSQPLEPAPPQHRAPDPVISPESVKTPGPGTPPESMKTSGPGNAPESGNARESGNPPGTDPLSVRNRPASRSVQHKTAQPDLAETPPVTPAKSSRRGYLILALLAVILAGAAAGLFLL